MLETVRYIIYKSMGQNVGSYRNIYIPENRSDTFQTQNHYNALNKNIQH